MFVTVHNCVDHIAQGQQPTVDVDALLQNIDIFTIQVDRSHLGWGQELPIETEQQSWVMFMTKERPKRELDLTVHPTQHSTGILST